MSCLYRHCLYPPCLGPSIKYEGSCRQYECTWSRNWKPGFHCYVGKGYTYQGNHIRTGKGRKCMKWNEKNPHTHRYTHDHFKEALNHNYCRNPEPVDLKIGRVGPWCFTNDETVRWEYCDIPPCPLYESQLITNDGPEPNTPCVFPLKFYDRYGKKFSLQWTCPSLPRRNPYNIWTKNRCYCPTINATSWYMNPDVYKTKYWGVCPSSYEGEWGPWTNTYQKTTKSYCSLPCGSSGYIFQERICMMPQQAVCRGLKTRRGSRCFPKPCAKAVKPFFVDCLQHLHGYKYNGNTKTDWKGRPCSKWTVASDPNLRFNHQFCRNPWARSRSGPYCYIKEGTEFNIHPCNIPYCKNATVSGAPYFVMAFNRRHNVVYPCKFPYRYKGIKYQSCMLHPVQKYYQCECHATGTFFYEQKMGVCLDTYKGIWSAWIYVCNRICDGGYIIQKRYCRMHPCTGKSEELTDITCNLHPCSKSMQDCYNVENGGLDFIGKVSVSVDGKQCVGHRYVGKERGKQQRNYPKHCLNHKDVQMPRPFCIINEVNGYTAKWCSVKQCTFKDSHIIMPFKVRTQLYDIEEYCVFPFTYKGVKHFGCINKKLPGPTKHTNTGYWCGTSYTLDIVPGNSERDNFFANGLQKPAEVFWGFCPVNYKGMWSDWIKQMGICIKECFVMKKRICLFEPCMGVDEVITMEYCNKGLCQFPVWGEWNKWSLCRSCESIEIRVRSCYSNNVLRNLCTGLDQESRPCVYSTTEAAACDFNYASEHIDNNRLREHLLAYYSTFDPEAENFINSPTEFSGFFSNFSDYLTSASDRFLNFFSNNSTLDYLDPFGFFTGSATSSSVSWLCWLLIFMFYCFTNE